MVELGEKKVCVGLVFDLIGCETAPTVPEITLKRKLKLTNAQNKLYTSSIAAAAKNASLS